MLAGKAAADLSEAQYRTFHAKGRLLSLFVSIRLGWDWYTVTNVTAFYSMKLITVIKSFIVHAPKTL